MRFSLIPREMKFFDMFDEAAAILTRAADAVPRHGHPVRPPRRAEPQALHREEHACDEVVGQIIQALDRSFITPFDREDIHTLATALDDVLDNMEETAHRFVVFRIERPTPAGVALARIIQRLLRATWSRPSGSAATMKDVEGIQGHLREISRLENEADQHLPRQRRRPVRQPAGHPAAHQVARAVRLAGGDGGRLQGRGAWSSPRSSSRAADHALLRDCQRATSAPCPGRSCRLAVWLLIAPGAGVRLPQRLPRRGQLGGHGRLDARAEPAGGRRLGGLLQLRRLPALPPEGGGDDGQGHHRPGRRRQPRDRGHAARRLRLGRAHLVLGPADQLVARADRRHGRGGAGRRRACDALQLGRHRQDGAVHLPGAADRHADRDWHRRGGDLAVPPRHAAAGGHGSSAAASCCRRRCTAWATAATTPRRRWASSSCC